MNTFVSIFCPVPSDMPEEDTLQELWRQHDQLGQEAVRMGRAVEHCFFHIGELDLEKPDKVFLHLMQCAQAKELGLLLVENMERFPLSPQAKIPQMEVYFVQEHQQETFGALEIQVEMDEDLPQHGYAYFGL